MKKYLKYLIITIIILCMPVIECYADDDLTYGSFLYTDNGDDITINSYFGSDKTVDIPAYIMNKKVTEIADYAFLLCNTVVTVNIPESVTVIGEKAFYGAVNLKNIITTPISEKETLEESENQEKGDEAETSYAGIEQDNVDVNKEIISNNSDKISNSEIQGIIVDKTNSVATVDDNSHLIVIDGNGNKVMLDDSNKYSLEESEGNNTKIVNQNGEEVLVNDEGDVIIPKSASKSDKSNYLKIIIVTAGFLVIVCCIIILFIKKKK